MTKRYYTYFVSSFFFNDTATTEIYTLSLHDALPISWRAASIISPIPGPARSRGASVNVRSEEHTSELQSQFHLVCRLLLEKKKNESYYNYEGGVKLKEHC